MMTLCESNWTKSQIKAWANKTSSHLASLKCPTSNLIWKFKFKNGQGYIYKKNYQNLWNNFKYKMGNYLLLISQILSLQRTNFIESTLHDVLVYKAGAFTYFFALKKSSLLKSMILINFPIPLYLSILIFLNISMILNNCSIQWFSFNVTIYPLFK